MAKRKQTPAKKKRASTKKKESRAKTAAKKAPAKKAKPRKAKSSRQAPAAKKPEAGISIRMIQDAADLGRDWLAKRSDYYSYLSKLDTPRGAPELARHLRGDLLAKQARDGSWGEENLATTADALWQLLDLELPANSPHLANALDWLYGRRDQEGSFGSGCTPARHDQRICEHYISGFFSPGPSSDSQEITLSNGQSVTSDIGARMLASERTLRSLLRAKPGDERASASISGLRAVPFYLDYGGNYTPAVQVGALQALAWAAGPLAAELKAGLEMMAKAQTKDGDWPNVEFFFVLETLLEVEHPLCIQMTEKALPKLLSGQYKDGSWGRRHSAAQTWIAVQTLERATKHQLRFRG